MALTTPEEWLPVLAARLDGLGSDLFTLRSYVNGNAPLPEMGKGTRATWLAFQKKARTNIGGIACQSHANRIVYRGVRVGGDSKSDVALAARRIARDNRLPMQISDAVWDMLTARRGHLVVGVGPDGRAIITSEAPEQFYAEPDPLYPWKVRAAIKVWRDTVAEIDYAMVWVAGVRQMFSRRSFTIANGSTDRIVRTVAAGGWEPGLTEEYIGEPPVWIFDRRDGKGLIEPHLDVIDRINYGKLLRLSTAAIQSFRMRAFKKSKDAPGDQLPKTDADGKPIDWEKALEAAPGALIDLPIGIDIWESGTTELGPLLDGEKADARDFGAVTGTPISMLQPDSANQSATGAAATTAQQVDACRADIERIRLAVASCLLTALRVEGFEVTDTVEVDFDDPQWVVLAEKYDAYSKAVASGMDIESAQKQILGWSQDQIDEDRANRTRSAALAAMANLAPAG